MVFLQIFLDMAKSIANNNLTTKKQGNEESAGVFKCVVQGQDRQHPRTFFQFDDPGHSSDITADVAMAQHDCFRCAGSA